jgi:hypothetical protein
VTRWSATLVALVVVAGIAHGDGMAMGARDGAATSSTFDAHIAIEAASFSPSQANNMFYSGDYQGVLAGAGWSPGRWAAGASWAFYRLLRNGLETYGVGDLMLHGTVALLARADVQAGVMLDVMAPTGNQEQGFGMGATMLMPAVWGGRHRGRLGLYASAGYSRALTSIAISHGVLPTVDPMNMSELSWTGSAEVAVASRIRVGGRLTGGVPIDYAGSDRVIGALRVVWTAGRVDTAAEFQAGLAGDPFNVRGLLSTAMRF